MGQTTRPNTAVGLSTTHMFHVFGRNNMAQKAIPARKAIRLFQKDNDKAALFRKVLYYHVPSPNLAVSRTEKKITQLSQLSAALRK